MARLSPTRRRRGGHKGPYALYGRLRPHGLPAVPRVQGFHGPPPSSRRPQGRPPRGRPRSLFDGVDLAIEPRTRACLVGRNGAGKSTLLRMSWARSSPTRGERFVQPGPASPCAAGAGDRRRRPCSTTPPSGGAEPLDGRGRAGDLRPRPGQADDRPVRRRDPPRRPGQRLRRRARRAAARRAHQPPRHPGHRDCWRKSWLQAAPPP